MPATRVNPITGGVIIAEQGISVESELMQNYRVEAPVSVTGQLAAVADRDGQLVLFSSGTDGQVYCFRRAQGSETGWSQTPTGLGGGKFAVGLDDAGDLVAFAPSAGSLSYAQEQPDGTWGAARQLPGPFGDVPIAHVKAGSVAGGLYVTIFYSVTGDTVTPPFVAFAGLWAGAATNFAQTLAPDYVLDGFGVEHGTDADGRPGFYTFLTPRLFTRVTNTYVSTPAYIDRGNGTPMYLSLWRPVVSYGFFRIGDYAVGGADSSVYNRPGGPLLTVASAEDPLGEPILAPPTGLTQVWNDRGSHAKEDGSTWAPEPPQGYAALGHLAGDGYDPPDASDYRCVRTDMLAPAVAYLNNDIVGHWGEVSNALLVYANWDGHGSPQRLAIDAVVPADAGGLVTYTFFSHQDWNTPSGTFYCPAQKPPLKSTILFTPDGAGRPSRVATDRDFRLFHYAAIENAAGRTEIFGVLGDKKLYHLNRQAGAWECLDEEHTFSRLAPTLGPSGRLEVFALDSDRRLHHVAQDAAAPSGWGLSVLLEQHRQFASLAAGRDGDGNTACFGVTTDNLLLAFFKDPATGNWAREEIEFQATGEVREIRTYSVEMTLLDASGLILPDTPVKVWAENTTPAFINTRHYLLDAVTHAPCVTNAAGRLTVVVEADTLYAPVLKIQTALMAEGDSIEVQPNADIQARLARVEAGELERALGVSAADAEQLAPAVRQAMSLIPTGLDPHALAGGQHQYRLRRATHRGVRFVAGAGREFVSRRIDPALVPEQHWRLDFAAGRPAFSTLTAEEAARAFAEERARGFSDWLGDLGDLADAVAEGVADVVSYTVSAAAGAVRAMIGVVMDGIKYLYDGVVNLVEQVFDVVGTVFKKIGAAFEQLFDWLGFLFDWDDILLTRAALAYAADQMFLFMEGCAGGLRRIVDAQIGGLEATVRARFEEFIKSLPVGETLGGYQRANDRPDPEAESKVSNNIFLNAFVDNAGTPQARRAFAAAGAALAEGAAARDLGDLLKRVAAYATDLQATQAFANAFDYFKQMGDNPDRAFELLLAGLLSVAEGVTLAVLEGVQAVLDLILDAAAALVGQLRALLKKPLSLPFISDLYAYITGGSELTLLDLVALMSAIPTTVFYKMAYDVAPFRNNADLGAFRRDFTAAGLLSLLGLGGGRSPEPEGARVGQAWKQFMGVAYSANYLVYGVLMTINDVQDPKVSTLPQGFTNAAYVAEVLLQVTGFPWGTIGTRSFDCLTAAGSVNWLWLYETIGVFVDGLFVTAGSLLPEESDAWALADTCIGAGALFFVTVAAATKGLKGASLEADLLSTVPMICKVMRTQQAIAASRGFSLPALGAIEFGSDVGVCYINRTTI